MLERGLSVVRTRQSSERGLRVDWAPEGVTATMFAAGQAHDKSAACSSAISIRSLSNADRTSLALSGWFYIVVVNQWQARGLRFLLNLVRFMP